MKNMHRTKIYLYKMFYLYFITSHNFFSSNTFTVCNNANYTMKTQILFNFYFNHSRKLQKLNIFHCSLSSNFYSYFVLQNENGH